MHIILKIGLGILIIGFAPFICFMMLSDLGMIEVPSVPVGNPGGEYHLLGFLAMFTLPIALPLILIGIVMTLIKKIKASKATI